MFKKTTQLFIFTCILAICLAASPSNTPLTQSAETAPAETGPETENVSYPIVDTGQVLADRQVCM